MNAFRVPYQRYAENIALIDADGKQLTYAELKLQVDDLAKKIAAHSLLILDCENCFESVIFYLAALQSNTPVFLVNPEDQANVENIKTHYAVSGHYRFHGDKGEGSWRLEKRDLPEVVAAKSHDQLAVVLSTSGSTGVAKQIKLSVKNLAANASSIIEYLGIDESDCAATTLPFNYSYGLSVVNSHLLAGATLFLNQRSLTDTGFWDDFARYKCSSFAGVPYSYELIEQSVFAERKFPHLKYFTQAGGKLSADTAKKFVQIALRKNAKFFVMYGQTEATARMAYVPPEALSKNADSIGIAIPGGEFFLRGSDGNIIEAANCEGELVYRGANIMMGYAKSQADLAIDENIGALHTGDLALCQENGFYKITGRKSRFIKPFGIRIGLDDLEAKLNMEGLSAACAGTDDCLQVMEDSGKALADVQKVVTQATRLPSSHIQIASVDEIPRRSNGKIDYRQVAEQMSRAPGLVHQLRGKVSAIFSKSKTSVKGIFEDKLDVNSVKGSDSFRKLGGDSLTFIQTSLALQDIIPDLPDDWHLRSVDELSRLASQKNKRRVMVKLDTAIFARFVAISMIVLGHFNILNYGIGSAFLLLFLAGYGFGNYHFSGILTKGRAVGQIRSLLKIAIPTVCYMLLLQISQGSVDVSSIFLISNFLSLNPLAYWFIEVYVQITVVMIGVLLLAHRSLTLRNNPYFLTCALLAISILISFAVPALIWDTDHLYNRLPHMLMWIFVFGILLSQTQDTYSKFLFSCLWLPLSYISFGEDTWFFHIGGLLIFWVPSVYVPRIFLKPIMLVASASLFIYLTHFQFKVVVEKVLSMEAPLLSFTVAMTGGVIVWKVYGMFEKFVVEKFALERRFALPQAKTDLP